MISLLLILLSSLFFVGIIIQTKAKIAARKMPSIFQPLSDVIRLFKKGAIYSSTTSIIFRAAPIVYFSSVLIAALFIPFGGNVGLLSFYGDFVFFAYLLAIGKFLMIIAAMDTGSGFEGIGANREALYSMLVEPAFFILAGSIALFTNNVSFQELFSNLHIVSSLSYSISVASIYVLIYIALVENSRMPVDDPKTHLELTMVHEVMVLDNSGFDLALIHIATWLKFAIYGSILANFLIKNTWSIYEQIGVYFVIQIAFAIIVGILESFKARNKMSKNPQWIIMLSAIAVVSFLTALIVAHKIILN